MADKTFWDWFLAHASELAGLSKQDEPLWDLTLEQLQRVDPRLWFELSETGTLPREFVITAEGDIDAFPIVEALFNRAPSIDGWVFVALKAAMGFDFKTVYEGVHLDPRRMWFLPLESPSRPNDLGLRIGVPDLGGIDPAAAKSALLMILDTGLGERSAAVDIQHVEICELPHDPEGEEFIELPELAAYIAWRKRRVNQHA